MTLSLASLNFLSSAIKWVSRGTGTRFLRHISGRCEQLIQRHVPGFPGGSLYRRDAQESYPLCDVSDIIRLAISLNGLQNALTFTVHSRCTVPISRFYKREDLGL